MPIAWGRHDKRQVFLNVAILDAAAAADVLAGRGLTNTLMFKALVDTGATGTCITSQTATKVGLKPIGKAAVHGVSGIQYHNNYLFYIGFTSPLGIPTPQGQPGSPQQLQLELSILPTPIQGAEFAAGMGFDVLLGMDVISTGSFKVEGDGTFSWAW